MRSLFALPLIALAACSSAGGARSETMSGVSATRSFAASGFDAVSLRGPDTVIVQTGKAASVSAVGDTAILDRLEIEVVGGELRIGRKKQNGFSWSSGEGVTVTVTVPAIKAAEIAGSGDMTVDTVSAPRFKGAIAGSGDLSIGAVRAEALDLAMAGSGDIRIAGVAKSIEISIAGSGDIDAGKVMAETGDISIAGSGNARAGISGSAKVSMVGSGDVEINGGGVCTVSKMGSGDVRCAPGRAAAAD